MAKYKLLAPHFLEIGQPHHRIAQYCDAGKVIDTADLPPWFKPSPNMQPLDDEAYAALRAVCDQIRAANGGGGSVPSIGSMHRQPGGELEGVH